MASEWQNVKFSELYKEPSRNGLTKPKKVRGEGYKFINMKEIFSFDRMVNIPCDRVPVSDKEIATSLLNSGDLLFARQSLVLSGAGKCSIFLADDEDVVFESHLIRVRLDTSVANSEYIFYFFKSPQGRSIMNTIVEQGAGQAGIRGSDLGSLIVPLPKLETQNRIVDLVSQYDLKIESNKVFNQTLEQMAQALFKSWFVDFDPVIDNALAAGSEIPDALQHRVEIRKKAHALQKQNPNIQPLPEAIQRLFPSEFEHCGDDTLGTQGWIPKGWKIIAIDELNTINPESWTKKNAPEGVRYVDLANAKNGTILEAEHYLFNDAPSRARRILRKHDIIIGVVRPANRSFAYVNENGLTGSTGFAVVRPLRESYRTFTYFSLTEDDCIAEFARIADGAAYPAIKPSDVAAVRCLYSDEKILEKFEKIAGQFLLKKAGNEQQIKPLQSLRDNFLPKLISGEVSLSSIKVDMKEQLE